MNLFKTLIIIIFCISSTGVIAQKKQLKKANNYFKLNQYKEAINLYEEVLSQKESLAASTKLAYCYRMTNQMAKAEEWYAKIVADEKARPITYFYYAEALMSKEKYDLAKNWFLKYNEKEPDDKNAIRMAYACDKVKSLEPYFPNVALKRFAHNTDADDSSPLFFNEGIVFTSDRSTGINPLKQKSGWTGRDYQRIYYSAHLGEGQYDSPGNFSKKLNDLNKHCGPVSFTEDKKTVVFSRSSQDAAKDNSYNIQLYTAQSEEGQKWKNVKRLSFCNKEHNYMHPAISPDGEKLFFVSDKPGGLGGTDIYMCQKKGDGWSKPINLGPIVNTPVNEAFPYFHSSGKLFFCSKGHLSFGGFDILFSNLKEDGSWQKPVNVGKPINSSYDDISISIDDDLTSGMFASSRDGGDDDIYLFEVMEGVNANLDTLDFEGDASWVAQQESTPVEPKQEEITTSKSEEKKEKAAVVEEQPVVNIAPRVKEDKEQEDIRKADLEKNTAKTEPKEMSNPPIDEKQVIVPPDNEITETAPTEPLVNNTPKSEELPDRKIAVKEEKKRLPDAERENKTSTDSAQKENTETSIADQPEKASKSDKSKRVNLIIPSKKKKKKKSRIPSKTNEPQTTSEPLAKVKKESQDNTQLTVSEKTKELADNEKTENKATILDREMEKSKPPVLMGDDNSMLAETPETLPRLAEHLQNNQPVMKKRFIISGVKYPQGSYLLSTEGTKSLTVLVDLLNMYPDLKVEIGSHTSALGDDIDNHNLSRKRAMSIMAFLVYKGIANDRISAKGYGETRLLNQCSNGVDCPKLAHDENDRIEVRVLE